MNRFSQGALLVWLSICLVVVLAQRPPPLRGGFFFFASQKGWTSVIDEWGACFIGFQCFLLVMYEVVPTVLVCVVIEANGKIELVS